MLPRLQTVRMYLSVFSPFQHIAEAVHFPEEKVVLLLVFLFYPLYQLLDIVNQKYFHYF